MTRQPRKTWITAILIAALIWLIGSYLPPLSNIWAQLNIIAPAGQPHLITLPMAYPSVGLDANTICSLLGLLIIIGATTRWITYLHIQTPDPTQPAPLHASARPQQPPVD